MTWKKNAVSYLMWAVYLFMVAAAMVFTGRAVCVSFGIGEYLAYVISAACLLSAGIVVFGLHRLAVRLDAGSGRAGKGMVWLERILISALFAAGVFFRMRELQRGLWAVHEGQDYLNLAYVSGSGQKLPRLSHGAGSLYICLLRLCFLLLGNKADVAVWLQIALQLSGVLLLYLAVRKMAGRIPAVLMVFSFMFSTDMVEKSLTPSPEMLYLLLFSIALLFLSHGVKYRHGWGFWLAAGVLSSVLCYLDVTGFLLLPLTAGVLLMRRRDAGGKIVPGLFGSLIGFLLGAAGSILVEMAGGGKSFSGIFRAWGDLYWRGELQLSVTLSGFDAVWPIVLLLCFMAWGIFSFWCDRGEERFTVWICCLFLAVFLHGMGIFTEEMNWFCPIFFFSTILAGLGIRESMTVSPAKEEPVKKKGKKTKTANAMGMPDGAEIVMENESEELEIIDMENVKTEMHGEESMEAGKVSEERGTGDIQPEKERKITFLENPLPLPKKHEKRVMDYQLASDKDLDGYDIYVADDDDFDH